VANKSRFEVGYRRPLCQLVLVLALWSPVAVPSDDSVNATVERRGERFILHSEVLVRVPKAHVQAILNHFEGLPRLNKSIRQVHILERRQNGQIRMRLRAEACVLLICLHYGWVQEVSRLANGDIRAVFDPTVSDFREGWTRYSFLAEGHGTRLIFDASLIPEFWFPPVIGTWLIRRKLAEETEETARQLEKLACFNP
jgi:hypothetical protein